MRRRILVSLAACAAGWLLGNSIIVLIALTFARDLDWRFWLLASGAFSVVGWLIVGLPLSVQARDYKPGRERIRAMLYSGLVGFGIILFLTLKYVFEGVRDPWRFVGVAGTQAIATAVLSMVVYCHLVDRVQGRR